MRTCVITGASGQLGQAFANHLAEIGSYELHLIDTVTPEKSIPGAHHHSVDITHESEVMNFYGNLRRVDVLINNAGIGVFTPFEDRTAEDFMKVVEVNLKGTFLMCREAVKRMKTSGGGKIVNIGSIYGVVSSDPRIYGKSGRQNSEVYSMTKAGVIQFTKYLAAHYARHNIQTNTLSPGGIRRQQSADFVENYEKKTPAGRMGLPVDLLPALEFLIDPKNVYCNGQNIVVDGGFCAW